MALKLAIESALGSKPGLEHHNLDRLLRGRQQTRCFSRAQGVEMSRNIGAMAQIDGLRNMPLGRIGQDGKLRQGKIGIEARLFPAQYSIDLVRQSLQRISVLIQQAVFQMRSGNIE